MDKEGDLLTFMDISKALKSGPMPPSLCEGQMPQHILVKIMSQCDSGTFFRDLWVMTRDLMPD